MSGVRTLRLFAERSLMVNRDSRDYPGLFKKTASTTLLFSSFVSLRYFTGYQATVEWNPLP